jgi:DNA-binding NarL/FixJ family response regulator
VAGPLTVLLSDRQPVVREGLRSWLRADDFDVVAEVGDAAQAVAETERLRPAIAVLGASAFDHAVAGACVEIASRSPETATVVLASAVDDDEVLKAAHAGTRAYLLKDTVDADLPGILRRVAAGERVVDAAAAAAVFRAQQHARPSLTGRELTIVRLAAEGFTNREIGERLYLSRHTVKDYLSTAMRKLEVDSRVAAAVEAERLGLLEPPILRQAS